MKSKILIIIFGVLATVFGIFTVALSLRYIMATKANKDLKSALLAWEGLYEEDIKGLNGLVSNKENEITDLEGEIGSYRTSIQEYIARIEEYKKNMADLEDEVSMLTDANYGIKAHGRLSVGESGLMDQNGNPLQLKGMSTHGISWYPRYTNAGAFKTMKEYGANVIRLSVYSEQPGSYQYASEENLNYLYTAIENALAVNMYVIVDWHVLKEENPNTTKAYAKEFFKEVSAHYGNHEGIIYEICNEPNGNTTWNQVCSYATEIIPIIRANAPDSVIIVGTPDFCVDVEDAAKKPLPYNNILYSMHAYFDLSKKDEYNANAKWYTSKFDLGVPVIVSEWGFTNVDGKIYTEQVDFFVQTMKDKNISWCNWSLCNKDEDHSIIKPDCNKLSGWQEDDLTVSGKLVLKALKD